MGISDNSLTIYRSGGKTGMLKSCLFVVYVIAFRVQVTSLSDVSGYSVQIKATISQT